ncbi:MAG: hypothetical protein HOZ81_50505 [Streptomyces sp.]|nr:hypothetical protein [Streptomyces sp.]NUS24407.1 hypothetical protein [Streptomyces sp.]
MSDTITIPDDLIALQRAAEAVRAELDQYVATVSAERREQYPGPEQVVERQHWPDELNAELNRLRATWAAATEAVRHHPVMVAALAEGRWHGTLTALRAAARS